MIGGVHLLVDARHARQDRRPHLGQRPGDVERVGQECDRVADVGAGEVHQPTEVVRERQVEQHHVARGAVIGEVVDRCDHRVVVAVPDHAALGRPRRPRRVDEGEEVLLVDRRDHVVEGLAVRVPVRATLLLERRKVGEGQHVPEREEARRGPPRPSLAARRPRRGRRRPPSARGRSARRRATSSRRSPRRPRRRGRARSRRAPTRACSARGSRTRRPCRRRARGGRWRGPRPGPPPRPTTPRATRRRSSTRYAGPVFRATASRHRRGIVRSPAIYSHSRWRGVPVDPEHRSVRP